MILISYSNGFWLDNISTWWRNESSCIATLVICDCLITLLCYSVCRWTLCVISSDVNGCPCITLFEYPKSWFIGNTSRRIGSTNQTKNLLHLALYAALISLSNIIIIEEEWRDCAAKGWLDSWKGKASGRWFQDMKTVPDSPCISFKDNWSPP